MDTEAGARLTCHLLLRLFKTIEVPQPALYSVGMSISFNNWVFKLVSPLSTINGVIVPYWWTILVLAMEYCPLVRNIDWLRLLYWSWFQDPVSLGPNTCRIFTLIGDLSKRKTDKSLTTVCCKFPSSLFENCGGSDS